MCCVTVKTLLNIINAVFAVAGAVVLGVGAYGTYKFDEYRDIIGDQKLPIAMVIFGVFILGTAAMGLLGVRKASSTDQADIKRGRCILLMYAVLMFVIFVAQLAIGSAIMVFIGGVSKIKDGCEGDSICEKAEEQVQKYVTCAFNITCQGADSCVGTSVKLAPKTTRNLMKDMGVEPGNKYCNDTASMQNHVVDYIVENFGRPVAGTFIGFALLEFFAFAFTICQLCNKKNKHTDPQSGQVYYSSMNAQKPTYGQTFFVQAVPTNYWACPACTFENHNDFAYCAMCNTRRPETATYGSATGIAGV